MPDHRIEGHVQVQTFELAPDRPPGLRATQYRRVDAAGFDELSYLELNAMFRFMAATKWDGPPPLAIDGAAYRQRARRRRP